MHVSAHQTYRRMQTATATPGELISLLYDALVRNLSRAETGLEARDLEQAHAALLKAQDIVLELISSLDTGAEGDPGQMARQIAPLYEYMYHRLLDASLHKDVEPVAEVRRLVQPVRDAWRLALEQVAAQAAAAPLMEVRRG
ncbi:MAG: flagellar export chaperone FliS [Dehalococcoidia bacterium]|nr:flagellar export chaperone FliS [Dehalococcoidia bacterium]